MPHPTRLILLFVGLLIFFAGPTLVRLYTDWLWFAETGYQQVFLTMLGSQAMLFAVAFALSAGWLILNLRLAINAMSDFRQVFTTRDGIELTLPSRGQIHLMALAAATLVSVLIALYAAGRWETFLMWRHGIPFGASDPILGHEVGFYVFSLPFLQFLRGLGQLLVVVAALAAGGLYLASGNLTSGFPATINLSPAARRHLSMLAVVFLLLLAFGAWLGRIEYLVRPGTIQGATYADVHGRMPAAFLLMIVSVIGAGMAGWQAFAGARRNWPIPVAFGLYFLVSIGGEMYSTALQRFVVSPNEQVREAPYIVHNIAATRRAFNLDRIEEREISGDAILTPDDIANNRATLDNVRLWDHQPLLDTFGQIQVIRTYYDFVSVDNDRYRLEGNLRQVMLSVRELNSAMLPNRTWVNERLVFTHGYGLTLGPVNQVTTEGLPVLFIRDLPPVTSTDLEVDEPSIYYGELSNDYVIVRTNAREFHYPTRGDDNVFTRYDGNGGVQLNSLWRKLLYALRFGSYQILLSDDILPESRILYYRSIRERVRTIAPFLAFDQDPYMVLADGRMYWIQDAYTRTGLYPYSAQAGPNLNYIRNSVKLVIDAYHGTTTAYLSDEEDPIAATYARMFPDIFVPLSEMPAAIREHVRYPEDIFAVQANMYTTYHMTSPSVFYNREDQWEIPRLDEGREGRIMQPYYTIMRLPGELEPEFIQMLPFTPRNRDNLAAWLVAQSDGEHYGRMHSFVFPKQKLIFGPRQVVARIAQDQVIAPQITLWNQQGSQVIWGTLMVIPIEESLVYIRPLYLRAAGGRIPELTRVIVAYENRIVMEETLDAGLARLFGPGVRPPVSFSENDIVRAPEVNDLGPAPVVAPRLPGLDPELARLADEARAHYERAIQAQREGDWGRYGDELRQLGDILERMRSR